MRALETIVSCLIGMFVFTGCTSTITSTVKQPGLIPTRQIASLTDSDIKIKREQVGGEKDIDQLIETSKDYMDYVTFRKKYSNYGEEIMGNIKSNNLEDADKLVKELANRLENDQNKYAQQYLGKVKNYSYIVYELYNLEEITKKEEPDLLLIAGAGPVFAVLSPWILIADIFSKDDILIECADGFVKKKSSTETVGKVAKKIRVTPYTGQREVIADNIPYETIKAELNRYEEKLEEVTKAPREPKSKNNNSDYIKPKQVVGQTYRREEPPRQTRDRDNSIDSLFSGYDRNDIDVLNAITKVKRWKASIEGRKQMTRDSYMNERVARALGEMKANAYGCNGEPQRTILIKGYQWLENREKNEH